MLSPEGSVGICLSELTLQTWIFFLKSSPKGIQHSVVQPEAFGDKKTIDPHQGGYIIFILWSSLMKSDGTQQDLPDAQKTTVDDLEN